MATAQNPIGRVTALHGQAFVRTPDGQQHELKLNDVVHEGDVIMTSAGGDVELSFGSGKTYSIHGSETATLDAAVFASDVPAPADAALVSDGKQLDNITQAIASGNSLDTLLEETAAGLTGGGSGSDGSHSFVQLLRVAETVASQGTHLFDPAASSGGPSQESGLTSVLPPTISVDPVTSDNVINAAEAAKTVAVTGLTGGGAQAGDVITITVNGHSFTGVVAADHTYSVNVAGSDLAAANTFTATITAVSGSASAIHAYAVDTVATASITIDSITADNIINAAEAAGNVNVSGTVGGDAKAGDTVTLTVNGHSYTGAVQAGNSYSIAVSGSDLAADSSVHGSVTATDTAGNTATATAGQTYVVDTTADASITINAITADNIVNAKEAAGSVNVTGTVGGDVKAGDTVTLTVNGHNYTGAVQAGNTYSIAVSGGDLAADSKVHGSVTATDAVGNTATATADQGYLVDMSATASITINSITSDNVINAREATGNISVSGTVGGDTKAGDTVTLTVNGHNYTGTVQANNTYSIQVSGSDLAASSSIHGSVTATDTAGNTATATADRGYSVHTEASASITINSITSDNVVDSKEAAGSVIVTGSVSGDAKAGDIVTLTVDGHAYTGAVLADGGYAIGVSGSDLAASTNVHASVTAQDAYGNTATASTDHAYAVSLAPAPVPATASITVDSITADNIINAAEAADDVNVTGRVGGDVKVGDTVTLTVNGSEYTDTVQAGGVYSISVAGSDLAAASSVHVSVTTTDTAGNPVTATADHGYSVATSGAASITVDSITADNIINAAEAADDVNVTGRVGGDAKVGDTVTLTVNGTEYTDTVQDGGVYSISVSGSDLAADSSVNVSVDATDAAGNPVTATVDHGYTVDTVAVASITVNAITADNIINAAEAAGSANVTGTAGGDAKAGDTVTLTVNGTAYTGAVQAGGGYSISVSGSDLAASNNVHASVTVSDAAGNTATATADHTYTVDTGISASLTINAVTADNVINASEAAGNVSVTGTAGGDAKAGDTVTLTVNGTAYTGTVQAGGGYSISVAGSDLAAASSVHASVTTMDAAGNKATVTADHAYTVDLTATASITINAITADNVINAKEAAGSVSVTGTAGGDAKAGDTVTLTVHGTEYTGAVQAGGGYSISVAGSDLAASNNVHASVTVSDAAGNKATATADHAYTVDTTATATITIDSITADNVISATEAAGNINVTGTVGGDAKAGDTVTLTVNGKTYTGTVAADDTYSISVKGSDLAAVSTVHASVAAADAAGNAVTATADHAYDNAPVVTAASATVSEEGLSGANPDTAGTPTDTTNSATATGHVTITDVDNTSFLVTLTAPTAAITSNGVALTWTGDGTGTLVGKAGSTTVMTIGIDNTGAYKVTLSGPVDHPDKTTEDVINFNVGVVVNDQSGGITKSTITVNVEDDSPIWTGASNNAIIEATAGAQLTGDLHLSIGADSGSLAKVAFTGSNLDASGNILATNGQYVTYNNMKLHYVDSNGSLTAVASDGTHVYTISGDPLAGAYNMTMLHSLDATVSTTTKFTSITAGNNNTYTMSDSGHAYNIIVTGTEIDNKTGKVVAATVNTNDSEFGVANNWIDIGDTLKFAFDTGMIGIKVTLDGNAFSANDHAVYTVHYTDGTTGTGTITGNASGSVTVDLSFDKHFDTIIFNGATDPYRLGLNAITGTSAKVDQSVQFNVAGIDSDGDTTSSHQITATLTYDGALNASTTTAGTAIGGGSAAETLVGGSGDDNLTGGAGNDVLTGGLGADTFVWHLADKGTAGTPTIDKVTDFGTAAYTAGGSGDRLDLRDLLQNENHTTGTGNLTSYLHFEKSGSDTIVHISSGGGFTNGVYAAGAEDQRVVLSNVDLAALYSTSSDAVIIQNLLANHKLVTD